MNARLLELLAGDEVDDLDPGIADDVQIFRLREVAARITAGNPFNVGDLVTVRSDAPIKGAGKPHLIIEINKDAPLYAGKPGDWPFATRADTIIISVVRDSIAPHAVPHWMLETYAEGRS